MEIMSFNYNISDLVKQANELFMKSECDTRQVNRMVYDVVISDEQVLQQINMHAHQFTHLSLIFPIIRTDINLHSLVNLVKFQWNSCQCRKFPSFLFHNIGHLKNLRELSLFIYLPCYSDESKYEVKYSEFLSLAQLENLEKLEIEIECGDYGLHNSRILYGYISQLQQIKHLRFSLPCQVVNSNQEINRLWPCVLSMTNLKSIDLNISLNSAQNVRGNNFYQIASASSLRVTLTKLSLKFIYGHFSLERIVAILNGLECFVNLQDFSFLMDMRRSDIQLNQILQRILFNNRKTLKRAQIFLPLMDNVNSYFSILQEVRDSYNILNVQFLQNLEYLELYTFGSLEVIGQQLLQCSSLKHLMIVTDVNNQFDQHLTQSFNSFFRQLLDFPSLLSFSIYDQEEFSSDIYDNYFNGFKNTVFQFSLKDFLDPYLLDLIKFNQLLAKSQKVQSEVQENKIEENQIANEQTADQLEEEENQEKGDDQNEEIQNEISDENQINVVIVNEGEITEEKMDHEKEETLFEVDLQVKQEEETNENLEQIESELLQKIKQLRLTHLSNEQEDEKDLKRYKEEQNEDQSLENNYFEVEFYDEYHEVIIKDEIFDIELPQYYISMGQIVQDYLHQKLQHLVARVIFQKQFLNVFIQQAFTIEQFNLLQNDLYNSN